MKANISNQTTKPFIVTVDGEVEKKLSYFGEPKLKEVINGWKQEISLQREMFVYDLLHRTNYRRIRNKIMADERNKRFEERIGLERIK